jgi:hypothetical protein
MEEIQRQAYLKGFHLLGPSIFRALEVDFFGYQHFKSSSSTILKRRAELHRDSCKFSLPLFPTAIKYAPNDDIREKLCTMQKTFQAEFGISPFTSLAAKYVSTKIALREIRNTFLPDKIPQPKLVKKAFRMSPRELTSV